MSDRSAHGAIGVLLDPLQRLVSCVTPEPLIRQAGRSPRVWSVQFPRNVVRLRGPGQRGLAVLMAIVVEEGGAGARFAARLAGYRYELKETGDRMLLAYHWHPVGVSPVTWPHLHLGDSLLGVDLSRAHLPTGPVSRQDLLRFAIVDLGVEPLRPDWREVLAAP